MMKSIDDFLNRITMYRLVEYYLGFLIGVAALLCFLGILPYDPYALLFSTGFFIAACWITNTIFAKTLGVPPNVESVYISALILALIITPLHNAHDLIFLGWAAVLAMASKYIVAIRGKHIFNPVAFAVAFTSLTINQNASWWIGNVPMLFFVAAGGVLIVRKIRRFDLVFSFFLTALGTILVFSLIQGTDLVTTLQDTVLASPLVFFALVILTEPLTTPPTTQLQIYYGTLVGVLFNPQVHLGSLYTTPELAILIGNVFSYLVGPKTKLVLKLQRKIQLAPDLVDFLFVPQRKLSYAPGQYMEWTLGHPDPDSRGNRRYFTLASSPTEKTLRLGVKFYPDSSSFKESMLCMDQNSEIVASQLAGDFTLPGNPKQKCVFIAGGIGITPFRSMIKYLIDRHQRRPIVLFFANRVISDIVYKDVFDEAQRKLGIRTIYTLTDTKRVPVGWSGEVGRINARLISQYVPDYWNCLFYLSGPNAMVTAYEETLLGMGVSGGQIKKDFFPGFA
jgi:ferredoxin-NADP reductase/Na+-translocating ferredoxin:NAD+ oxidoreductase RnfD subunit